MTHDDATPANTEMDDPERQLASYELGDKAIFAAAPQHWRETLQANRI